MWILQCILEYCDSSFYTPTRFKIVNPEFATLSLKFEFRIWAQPE